MQVFSSKVDTWLFVIIVAVAMLSGISAISLLATERNYLMALITLALGAGLPMWILLSTKYVIIEEELRVRSGPFRWTVSIPSISSVQSTHNPLSSPALSLDRLEIRYGSNRSILVSPKHRSRFIQAIGQTES
ncbi:MAG: PH domain-containing protein [Cyanobacteria bacterium P01_B01_bin.77]